MNLDTSRVVRIVSATRSADLQRLVRAARQVGQRAKLDLAALVLSGPVVGGNPQVKTLLGMVPIPEIPIDPGILSRDPAVGEAYAADELACNGGFHRATLEAIFAGARAAVLRRQPHTLRTVLRPA